MRIIKFLIAIQICYLGLGYQSNAMNSIEDPTTETLSEGTAAGDYLPSWLRQSEDDAASDDEVAVVTSYSVSLDPEDPETSEDELPPVLGYVPTVQSNESESPDSPIIVIH